jgi:hypothetical protein
MLKGLVFAATLIIVPATALADWEFTRWGMTADEVEKASRYSAIRNGLGYGCLMQMDGPYTFQGVPFQLIRFCFDDETLLESVALLTRANAYGTVERNLRKTYGPPQSTRRVDKPDPLWMDAENRNEISLSRAEGTVLTYHQVR